MKVREALTSNECIKTSTNTSAHLSVSRSSVLVLERGKGKGRKKGEVSVCTKTWSQNDTTLASARFALYNMKL
ncbi:MAG: hypothetical protein ACKESB_01165 [Candidatus Hodgkinia cicadicola]